MDRNAEIGGEESGYCSRLFLLVQLPDTAKGQLDELKMYESLTTERTLRKTNGTSEVGVKVQAAARYDQTFRESSCSRMKRDIHGYIYFTDT